jgi:hypothetical protein
MKRQYRTLTQELEELERTDPNVAEAARRLDQLPESFARYDRHMAARAVVGKRSQHTEDR